MGKVEDRIQRKALIDYNIFKIVGKCFNGYRTGPVCSAYVSCKQELDNIAEWIYSNESPYKVHDILIL